VVEDWHFDQLRHFIEGLAAGRTVVRYNRLGTGLSDRERPPETFTPEFEDAMLCAVLDQRGLAQMTMMGISCGGCTAASETLIGQ
jgi:pimeloyl-ACP methyl ester carboxylesterase